MIKQTKGMRLDVLIDRMKGLDFAGGKMAADAAVDPVYQLVDASFDKQSNPAGEKWAALKYKKLQKGHKILEGLKYTMSIVRDWSRLIVKSSKPYARFHHTGTRYMAERSFLPHGDRPIPLTWSHKISLAIQKSIQRFVRRGIRS